jgi:hypothetical protein
VAVPTFVQLQEYERERCRCKCGASHSTAEWRALSPVGVWTTDEGVLELRVCVCGSTISAPFSFASSTLAAPGSPADIAADATEPKHSMFFRVGTDRFQAWCTCMRKSPLVAGTPADVERALADLDWRAGGETWTCPVCSSRTDRRVLPARDD